MNYKYVQSLKIKQFRFETKIFMKVVKINEK